MACAAACLGYPEYWQHLPIWPLLARQFTYQQRMD
jgi:hypothetical protein